MDPLSLLSTYWDLFTKEPLAFIATAVVTYGLGFAVSRALASSERTANIARLKLAEDRVTDYREKLEGASPEEAAAQLDRLEQALKSTRPLVLSKKLARVLRDQLKQYPWAVEIKRSSKDSAVDAAARQFEQIFSAAGWAVEYHDTLGYFDKDRPNSGVMIRHVGESDLEQAKLVASAFQSIGIEAEIAPMSGHATNINPELWLSVPFEQIDLDEIT